MTTVYHYGKWVDDETPITGVVSCNNVEWIHDETMTGINITEEEAYDQAFTDWKNSLPHDVEPTEDMIEHFTNQFWDYYDSQGDSYLIGGWIQDEADGKYDIDPTSDYSALVNYESNLVYVLHSKYATRSALCSPCNPGQCDLDTPGDFLGFDLPLDIYGNNRENPNKPEELKVAA